MWCNCTVYTSSSERCFHKTFAAGVESRNVYVHSDCSNRRIMALPKAAERDSARCTRGVHCAGTAGRRHKTSDISRSGPASINQICISAMQHKRTYVVVEVD